MDRFAAIAELRGLYAPAPEPTPDPKSVWLPREAADVSAGLLELHALNS